MGEIQQELMQLGLTRADLIEELLALTADDYSSGPEADRDRPGEVWIFGLQIKSIEFYLKLKIAKWIPKDTGCEASCAKIISFHKAKFPLNYPLN